MEKKRASSFGKSICMHLINNFSSFYPKKSQVDQVSFSISVTSSCCEKISWALLQAKWSESLNAGALVHELGYFVSRCGLFFVWGLPHIFLMATKVAMPASMQESWIVSGLIFLWMKTHWAHPIVLIRFVVPSCTQWLPQHEHDIDPNRSHTT